MVTTAPLIIWGVQPHSPGNPGDFLLVGSAAAAASTPNVTASWRCRSDAATNAVSSSAPAFFNIGAAADSHAIRMIFFDFAMELMPMLIGSVGACEMLANSYACAIRVALSCVIRRVLA